MIIVERMADVLVVDSRLIAKRLGIAHKNFLATIDKFNPKMAQSTRIQAVAFSTRLVKRPQGGTFEERWALLTEPQANFLMSLSRNTDEVVQCKIELIEAFEQAKELLKQPSKHPVGQWYDRLGLFSRHNQIDEAKWFCVFKELASLMWDLEKLGYIIPDCSPITGQRMVPDISIGLMFCAHCRAQGISLKDKVKPYDHHYPWLKFTIPANLYAVELLPMFRQWFNSQWKLTRLADYLAERDKTAIVPVHELLGLPIVEQYDIWGDSEVVFKVKKLKGKGAIKP